MQINKTNNIILLKNVESNIIEEAFVILKENVKINDKKYFESNNKFEPNTNLNLLKEAELIINQEIKKSDYEYEKFKVSKLENKLKRLKIINILLVISFLIFILINH